MRRNYISGSGSAHTSGSGIPLILFVWMIFYALKENKSPYDFGWEIRCTYLCNTGPYLNWSLVPKSS